MYQHAGVTPRRPLQGHVPTEPVGETSMRRYGLTLRPVRCLSASRPHARTTTRPAVLPSLVRVPRPKAAIGATDGRSIPPMSQAGPEQGRLPLAEVGVQATVMEALVCLGWLVARDGQLSPSPEETRIMGSFVTTSCTYADSILGAVECFVCRAALPQARGGRPTPANPS